MDLKVLYDKAKKVLSGDEVQRYEMPQISEDSPQALKASLPASASSPGGSAKARDDVPEISKKDVPEPLQTSIDTSSPHSSAHEAMKELRRDIAPLWSHLKQALDKDGSPDFPLLYENEPSKVVIMSPEVFGKPENWFFIGDIHADFFALHTLLNAIKTQCPDFRLVFMGDLVDRGEQPIECFFLLLKWARQHPEQIIWLAGNHDIAFSYDKEQKQFVSSVRPSEFLHLLNLDDEMQSFRKPLGDFLVKLSAMLPRAVLFPDGLLATHGGFPLVDKQEEAKGLSSPEDFMSWLNSEKCLQDFTWTRITRYPKRAPNRSSKGCSYGFQDFDSFCNLKPELFPVKRMVTGHEHPATGWEEFPTYKNNPALTICGFGFDYMLDAPAKFYKYKSRLVCGRYRRDSLPEKIEVEYSLAELHKFYQPPEDPTAEPANVPEAPASGTGTSQPIPTQ